MVRHPSIVWRFFSSETSEFIGTWDSTSALVWRIKNGFVWSGLFWWFDLLSNFSMAVSMFGNFGYV